MLFIYAVEKELPFLRNLARYRGKNGGKLSGKRVKLRPWKYAYVHNIKIQDVISVILHRKCEESFT